VARLGANEAQGLSGDMDLGSMWPRPVAPFEIGAHPKGLEGGIATGEPGFGMPPDAAAPGARPG